MENKERKTTTKFLWIVISVATGIALLAVCFAILYNSWTNPVSVFEAGAASPNAQINVPDQVVLVDENDQRIDQKALKEIILNKVFQNQSVVNILLMGIDTSVAREEKNMSWRSDMIILCTVNFKSNTIALTSIPRDTQTYIYHIDENGNATKIQMTKLNSGYSYGLGPDKYGALNEMLAVHDFLSQASGMDIPVQY
ncbi:MAG: LCP family protein, partial [Eubacteriales bacterium]